MTETTIQGERFIAYLLGRDAGTLDFDTLRRALDRRFPKLSGALSPLELPQLHGSGIGCVLGGIPFSCIAVQARLPRPEWEAGVRANLAWRDAASVIANHAEHIILSPIQAVSGHEDALRKATLTTILAGVLAEARDVSAICWVPAHTLIEAGAFQHMAAALVESTSFDALPLDAWMRLEFGRMEGRYAAIARGLRPFLGRELGVLGDAPDPAGHGAVLYDAVGHLIRNGPVFSDDDTMDMAQGRFRARISEDGRMLWLEPRGGR